MHSDARKSARIYPDTNTMHCFAEGRSWDPVAVVAEQEGIGMAEAAKIITDGAGVRWKAVGPHKEFGKFLSKYRGESSEADIKLMRLEIHDQALALRSQGADVDWEGFDSAHMDLEKLKAWVAELRSQVYD